MSLMKCLAETSQHQGHEVAPLNRTFKKEKLPTKHNVKLLVFAGEFVLHVLYYHLDFTANNKIYIKKGPC